MMKEMEVELISTETIKPSSPTPLHLKTYKVSLLDQLYHSRYVPLLFFYATTNTNVNGKAKTLKKSLSETLTRFYPFAGKLKDDLHIDCNDEGALFIEAIVKSHQLSEFLHQPDSDLMQQLLPCMPLGTETEGSYLVAVQLNVFKCGGIAIATKTSHRIMDGMTTLNFIKDWSKIACKSSGEVLLLPSFIAPSLFPQNPNLPKDFLMVTNPKSFKVGKCVTKRFVFDAESIVSLKAVIKHTSPTPTRFEAVTSLLWKCAMEASKITYGAQRASVLSTAVNLRRRITPPISSNSVGNIIWHPPALCETSENIELGSLIEIIRKSLSNINGDFVQEIQGEKGFLKVCETMKKVSEIYSDKEVEYYLCTSICKFGFSEIDFGWGKPIWATFGPRGGPMYKNLFILTDTILGDGIQASVTLSEEDMAVMEHNSELLTFSSIQLSPLDHGNQVINV